MAFFLLPAIAFLSGCGQIGQLNLQIVRPDSTPGEVTTTDECPQDAPSLDGDRVESIALEDTPFVASGQARSQTSLGYTFTAEAGQKLNYRTEDDLCVWVYAPDNELVTGKTMPETGTYTVQIAVLKGSTTFELQMSLEDEMASAPSTVVAQPTTTPTQTPIIVAEEPVRQSPPPSSPPTVSTHRVQFARNASGASLGGRVSSTQIDRHLLWCAGGQTMSVSVRTGDVYVAILDPNGRTIARLAESNRSWRGQLPSNGDYSIEVSSSQTSDYVVSVGVL